jgi:hypothetical protein
VNTDSGVKMNTFLHLPEWVFNFTGIRNIKTSLSGRDPVVTFLYLQKQSFADHSRQKEIEFLVSKKRARSEPLLTMRRLTGERTIDTYPVGLLLPINRVTGT